MADLPVCPECSRKLERHCFGCGWLRCGYCETVYGGSNVIRYGRAAVNEAEADRRKNGK